MTDLDETRLEPLPDPEPEPQETDNGPKPGDAPVPDQETIEINDGAGGPRGRTGVRAADVLARARRYLGVVEQPPGSNQQEFGRDYGWDGVAWCNIFVSEIGRQVSGSYALLGKHAWTPACAEAWRGAGRFGRTPRPGAVVFFDWSGSKQLAAIDHVGLVIEALPNGRVRTIEGNAAIHGEPEGVWIHDRSTTSIVGYGYPAYAGTDPAPEPDPDDIVPGSTFRPYQKVAAGSRAVRLLDAGDDVRVLQNNIGAAGDGYFGALTRKQTDGLPTQTGTQPRRRRRTQGLDVAPEEEDPGDRPTVPWRDPTWKSRRDRDRRADTAHGQGLEDRR